MSFYGGGHLIKQTYYNLSDEKKQRIIQAIKKEVDGKSYDKISINQIVANAEISRGSFYQYFDDKQDIFLLLLDGFTDGIHRTFLETLRNSDGDIFQACLNVFDYVLTSYEYENYSIALKSVFLYSNINSMMLLKNDECETCLNKEISRYINRREFHIDNEETIGCITDILFSSMSKLWFDVFILHKSKKTTKARLAQILTIVKDGVVRR